jgi:hypothetical protein
MLLKIVYLVQNLRSVRNATTRSGVFVKVKVKVKVSLLQAMEAHRVARG